MRRQIRPLHLQRHRSHLLQRRHRHIKKLSRQTMVPKFEPGPEFFLATRILLRGDAPQLVAGLDRQLLIPVDRQMQVQRLQHTLLILVRCVRGFELLLEELRRKLIIDGIENLGCREERRCRIDIVFEREPQRLLDSRQRRLEFLLLDVTLRARSQHRHQNLRLGLTAGTHQRDRILHPFRQVFLSGRRKGKRNEEDRQGKGFHSMHERP